MDKVVMYPDLSERFGIRYTRQHVSRLEKKGKFPRRLKLNGFRVVWYEWQIIEWVKRQALPLVA